MKTPTIVLSAAILVSILAPAAYALLRRYQVIDVPNFRSSHNQPTIRGGGIACAAGILVATFYLDFSGTQVPWPAILAGLFMAGVGAVDDFRSLPPVVRLSLQAVTGAVLGATSGNLWTALLGLITVPIVVNVVNFMDGLNGVTSLTVIAWASVILLSPTGVVAPRASIIAALALGAAVAFLPWNALRARMFLGDSGSYLFGTLIAAAILSSPPLSVAVVPVVAPLSVYLFDTSLTLARRALRGQPLTSPHRQHLYQRLQSVREMPHIAVAVIVAIATAIVGSAWSYLPALFAAVITVTVLGLYYYTADSKLTLHGLRRGNA